MTENLKAMATKPVGLKSIPQIHSLVQELSPSSYPLSFTGALYVCACTHNFKAGLGYKLKTYFK